MKCGGILNENNNILINKTCTASLVTLLSHDFYYDYQYKALAIIITYLCYLCLFSDSGPYGSSTSDSSILVLGWRMRGKTAVFAVYF